MRLSNQQIDVIVRLQRKKHEISEGKRMDKIRSDKKIVARAKEICAIGAKIPAPIRRALYVDKFNKKKCC